ncbi:MAG: DUF1553 domain-containing protein, partial [Planctomycetes bacterium]|nr:DUF1553 domain-containing protein [Planctomycetota bacterium]
QIVATGFHRNTLINEEGGTDPEQFRVEAVVDRVNTTGTVFLGLTLGCCQCHDHKYDPVTQREYYQFFAYFNNAAFVGSDPMAPRIDVPSVEQIEQKEPERRDKIRAEISNLESELKQAEDSIAADQTEWEKTLTDDDKKKMPFNVKNAADLPPRDRSETHKQDLNNYFREQTVARQKYSQLDQISNLKAIAPKFPTTMIMQELAEPRETFIHIRGDFLRKGAKVDSAIPVVLRSNSSVQSKSTNDSPASSFAPKSRLDLARWLVSSENPLTSRVTINRIWLKYFGRGIVETENDFGTQGSPPTHPELLDWLAHDFRDSQHLNWNLKAFHRRIVTSSVYRQSSHVRPELAEIDPTNKWLGRQNRLRLDA